MIIKLFTVLLAALALAMSTGCGNDDSSSDASGQPNDAVTQGDDSSGDVSDTGDRDGENDDEAAPLTASSLSKSEYVKKVNALCEEERGELVREAGIFVEEHGGAEGESVVDPETVIEATKEIVVPGMEEQIEMIRALGVPAGMAKDVEAFLDTWHAAVQQGAELSNAAETAQIFIPAAFAAEQLGIDECAYR